MEARLVRYCLCKSPCHLLLRHLPVNRQFILNTLTLAHVKLWDISRTFRGHTFWIAVLTDSVGISLGALAREMDARGRLRSEEL